MRKLALTLIAAVCMTVCLSCWMAEAGKSRRCAMCTRKMKSSSRTVYTVVLKSEKEKVCCCAHCGTLLQRRLKKDAKSARTLDYLSGAKVDAAKALYVVNSKERPCCHPSVLAFREKKDAEKFSEKRGGAVLSYKEVCDVLSGKRKLPK